MAETTSKFSKAYFFQPIIFLCVAIFMLGCSAKVVDPTLLNPVMLPLQKQKNIAVYDSMDEHIVFYDFALQEGIWMEHSWAKRLPFRVEFMDLWVTGLGHDLRRLTNNHAETINDALMYAAQKEGMTPLHINQKDYIIDTAFAHAMVDAIKAYEERMDRYNKDREFPFLLLPLR